MPLPVPARYIVAILGSVSFAIIYGLRVNLSVAIVGMLNHTAIAASQGISRNDDDGGIVVNELDGPFVWPAEVQGIVLSCYFWGYFVSQIPGGRIADLYSAKWVLFFAVSINVVCTLLTPVMCYVHYFGVVVMRVGEGIGGGVLFPASHTLLSKWAPPAERTFMVALTFAGSSLGTVASMLLAGVLTAHIGWESVFYIMGGLSLIWCVLWVILIQDSPQEQKLMTDEERTMILNALGSTRVQGHEKLPVPWGAIFKSAPFQAILIAHTCSNFGWYMLTIQLPAYMKQVLKFTITENALAVSLPFLTLWLFSTGLSRTLDWLRAKTIINTTKARKIATGIATIIPGACLIGISYIEDNRAAAVALITICITCLGAMFSGFLTSHIDIAPNFAGTLMAITNTVASIPGIVVPIYVNFLTYGNQTLSAWRVVFLTTSAFYLVELIVYTIFASGEVQPWNKVEIRPGRTK